MFLQPPPQSLNECKYTAESFLQKTGFTRKKREPIKELVVKLPVKNLIIEGNKEKPLEKKEISLESLMDVK